MSTRENIRLIARTPFPWILYPTGNPQDKKVWVTLRLLRDDLFTCVALHHRGTHANSTAC